MPLSVTLALSTDLKLKMDFDLVHFTNCRIFRVTKISRHTPECVTLEYDPKHINDYKTNPIIIGAIVTESEKETETPNLILCALWDNCLWRILDTDAASMIATLGSVLQVLPGTLPPGILHLFDRIAKYHKELEAKTIWQIPDH